MNFKLYTMKTKILLISLLYPLFMSSQDISEKRKNIENQKIDFITQKIDLSDQESEKFWPIYNKFHEQTRIIREKRKNLTKGKDRSLITEEEMGNIINEKLKMEQDILDLKVNYTKNLQKVISNKKISALHLAEEEFKKYLLKRIKGNNNKRSR